MCDLCLDGAFPLPRCGWGKTADSISESVSDETVVVLLTPLLSVLLHFDL